MNPTLKIKHEPNKYTNLINTRDYIIIQCDTLPCNIQM